MKLSKLWTTGVRLLAKLKNQFVAIAQLVLVLQKPRFKNLLFQLIHGKLFVGVVVVFYYHLTHSWGAVSSAHSWKMLSDTHHRVVWHCVNRHYTIRLNFEFPVILSPVAPLGGEHRHWQWKKALKDKRTFWSEMRPNYLCSPRVVERTTNLQHQLLWCRAACSLLQAGSS